VAETNQTLPNVLASFLGGIAGGLAGGVVATWLKKAAPPEAPSIKLIPLEGKGHYYRIPLAQDWCWVDDLCLFHLFPSARDVREVARGYSFKFPNNELVWLRVSSLVAPQQVGRLFEVKGADSVRVLLERCKILADHREAEEIPVRMVGGTLAEYEEQIEADGRRHDVR
jgi:hypothetical protein